MTRPRKYILYNDFNLLQTALATEFVNNGCKSFFKCNRTESFGKTITNKHSNTNSNFFVIVSDFNQDGKSDNITFMVKRIKVHTIDALKDPLYRFPNNYGVEKFLELFSGK